MIQLQAICKILNDKSLSFCTLNNITEEYFSEYSEEFNYIVDHYNKYGNVPDKETFISIFPDFKFVAVDESIKYIVDALYEDFTYRKSYKVLEKVNDLMVNDDSRKGVEYLLSQMPDLLQKLNVEAVDIIHEGAQKRFEEYCDKGEHLEKYYIPTGLKEVDELIGGWSKENDLVAICGRPGQGKSWWMDLFLLNAVKQGLTVALYSGEMNESQVGSRMDTFFGHISNYKITKGFNDIFDDYKTHIENIQKMKGKLLVCTPKTLGGPATVAKLKAFCERYKVDILGIDQFSLLTDIKYHRGRVEIYESISQDLKNLQMELGIPILVNAQLSRAAVADGVQEPGTEHIYGSDRLGQDASIVISIVRKPQNKVIINLTKVREGQTGGKLVYSWDIDKGVLTYIPTETTETAHEEQTEPENRPISRKRNRNSEQIVGGDVAF